MSGEMSLEAQEALANVKMGGLKKQINAASWSPNMEELMKGWGEKAAGNRFMHNHASGYWRGVSNRLTMWGIIVSTVASTASFTTAGLKDEGIKDIVMYAVGGIGVVSTLIQSIKKFYNADEKSAEHGAIAKQFGSFYRHMTMQMNMSREDRDPSDVLCAWALKEYERLQQDSPPLSGDVVKVFKKTFKDSTQAVPDCCEDEFVINVCNNEQEADIESNKPETPPSSPKIVESK